MSVREQLDTILGKLSDKRLEEILDFASFLGWRDNQQRGEDQEWKQFAMRQFARAYGDDEPEYTEADLKPEPHS